MKPIIGLTMNIVDGRYVLNEPYVDAIETCGGIPFCIVNDEDKIIQQIDGLLLTGGDDINPKFFGEKPHPMLGAVSEKRDVVELQLVKKCLKKKIPIFGICRGIQLLNVFFGGSLYQHIDAQVNTNIRHKQKEKRTEKTHEVEVKKESKLYDIVGNTTLFVNSMHHQAIRVIGNGLKEVCNASDGIIEGVEMENYPFCIAVQWHPEELVKEGDTPSKQLFRAFIESARKYRNTLEK